LQIGKQGMAGILDRLVEVVTSVCGSARGGLVRKHLRVSGKGNIVLALPVLLGKKFLAELGASSVNEIEKFIELMHPDTAAKIASWAIEAEQGVTSHIRELQRDDFVLSGELPGDDETSLVEAFLATHREYAARLEKDAVSVFGAVSEALPPGIRERIACRPCPDTVKTAPDPSLLQLSPGYFMECACGFTATVTRRGKPAVLPRLEAADSRAMNAAAQKHVFGDPNGHLRLVSLTKQRQEQAARLLEEYYLTPEASHAGEQLATFVQAVTGARLVRTADGWRIGDLPVGRPSAESLVAMAEGMLAVIEAGKIVLRQEASQMVRNFWREHVEPVCRGYEELYDSLPWTARLSPALGKAYADLQAFVRDWSSGVIRDGRVVGRYGLHQLDPDKVRTDAARLVNEFRRQAETRPGSRDQPVVDAALRLVAGNPDRMGVTTAAAVLAGSRARKVTERGLDHLPAYGLFRGHSQENIASTLTRMVADHLLEVSHVGRHRLPVLHVPKHVRTAMKQRHPEPEAPARPQEEDRRGTGPGDQPARKPAPAPRDVEEAVRRRAWDTLAGMSDGGDWAAAVALGLAAELWPSGKAARIVKTRDHAGSKIVPADSGEDTVVAR